MSYKDANLVLPKQMANVGQAFAYDKIAKKPLTSFMLAIYAGLFIAIAFVFYVTVTTGSTGSWGATRFLGGFVFSMGLILVVLCGAELFTSTVMSLMARASGQATTKELLSCWGRVFLGNLVGSLFLVMLIMGGSVYMSNHGGWGLNALNIAQHKIHHTFIEAFCLGILCNLMVCLGVWLTFSAQNALTKSLLVILPVAMFVCSGFEHCVANMFMIPMGISIHAFADASFWTQVGVDASKYADLTVANFIVKNLIPVTLGNIVGGAVLVGLGFRTIYRPTTPSITASAPAPASQATVSYQQAEAK